MQAQRSTYLDVIRAKYACQIVDRLLSKKSLKRNSLTYNSELKYLLTTEI